MLERQSRTVTARWLGFAGVLPFAITTVNLHSGWPLFDGFALQVFIVYSAAILSFLGGIRWGLAARIEQSPASEFVIAIAPSLIAVAAVLLPRPGWQVLALAAGFVAVGLVDYLRPAGMPAWLHSLRWQLTALVLLTHLLAWLAIRSW